MALINVLKEGGVAVLELNAPPANTYSYEMMRELDGHVLEFLMGVLWAVTAPQRLGQANDLAAPLKAGVAQRSGHDERHVWHRGDEHVRARN